MHCRRILQFFVEKNTPPFTMDGMQSLRRRYQSKCIQVDYSLDRCASSLEGFSFLLRSDIFKSEVSSNGKLEQ